MNIPWYRPLLEAVEVKRHIFWHCSALNRTDDLVGDFERSRVREAKINFIDCANLPIKPNNDLNVEEIESLEVEILIVVNFDILLKINRGKTWMRQLRPAVLHHVMRGTRLIVASNAPQSHYPAIDGSSLATDCVQFIGGPWRYEQLLQHSSPDDARRILSLTGGMTGPAAELVCSFPDLSRAKGKDAVVCLTKRVTSTMIECGSESISWLESFVLLRGERSAPYDEIPANLAATLHASGLGRLDPQSDCLEILPGVSEAVVKTCIELAERSFLDAPAQWTTIAASLFKFERTARAVLADSTATQGDLLTLLKGHSEKIRRNFASENGIPAPELGALPNPARWIDLSDLLDLLIDISENSRVGGLTSKQWTAAKADVLPLRNKIQHMRLPSVGDKQAIERHLRSIMR